MSKDVTKISLAEYLDMGYTLDYLKQYAEYLKVPVRKGMTSEALAKAIADKRLEPAEMKKAFLCADDEVIAAIREIVEMDGPAVMPQEQRTITDKLMGTGYIIMMQDGSITLPYDAKEVFRTIDTDEYAKERADATWILRCLLAGSMLYGATPIEILCDMFRTRKDGTYSDQDIIDIYNALPASINWYEIADGLFVPGKTAANGTYKQITESQAAVEYYIPDYAVIEDLTEKGYVSKSEAYNQLKSYLTGKLEYEALIVEYCCSALWSVLSSGGTVKDAMEILEKQGLVADEAPEITTAIRSYVDIIAAETRIIALKGNTINEVTNGAVTAAGVTETVNKITGKDTKLN